MILLACHTRGVPLRRVISAGTFSSGGALHARVRRYPLIFCAKLCIASRRVKFPFFAQGATGEDVPSIARRLTSRSALKGTSAVTDAAVNRSIGCVARGITDRVATRDSIVSEVCICRRARDTRARAHKIVGSALTTLGNERLVVARCVYVSRSAGNARVVGSILVRGAKISFALIPRRVFIRVVAPLVDFIPRGCTI